MNCISCQAWDRIDAKEFLGCSADVVMAGWSWAEFFNDKSWEKFGWAALDTAALLPLLPSSSYFRQGWKTYLKMDEVKKLSRTEKGRQAIARAMQVRHVSPHLVNKLDYAFWRATGSADNIRRSLSMKATLWNIGIFDTSTGRNLLYNHIARDLNTAGNIIKIDSRPWKAGRVTKQSLLVWPFGFARVETVWEGTTLITLWITNSTTLLPIIK